MTTPLSNTKDRLLRLLAFHDNASQAIRYTLSLLAQNAAGETRGRKANSTADNGHSIERAAIGLDEQRRQQKREYQQKWHAQREAKREADRKRAARNRAKRKAAKAAGAKPLTAKRAAHVTPERAGKKRPYTNGYSKKILKQRTLTNQILAQFDRNDPRIPSQVNPSPGYGLGALVRRGYLAPQGGGYVRTAKAFHINPNEAE